MLSVRQVLINICYLYGEGSHLQYKVQFVWVNQEDDAEVIPNLFYFLFFIFS